jgi:hypothetical protein
MDMEILGLLGSVFAAAALAAIAFERRMDVLHGSYLERLGAQCHPARQLWTPSAIDRLRWKTQNVIHLASIIAC